MRTIVVAAVSVLTGCASTVPASPQQTIALVHDGMSRDAVASLLGRPNAFFGPRWEYRDFNHSGLTLLLSFDDRDTASHCTVMSLQNLAHVPATTCKNVAELGRS